MVIEDAQNKVLEYFKKASPINTFRLARDLGVISFMNKNIQNLKVPEMLKI